MDVDPYIRQTIDAIPEDELRPFAAQLLTFALMTCGKGWMCEQFETLNKHLVEPVTYGWPPPEAGMC